MGRFTMKFKWRYATVELKVFNLNIVVKLNLEINIISGIVRISHAISRGGAIKRV